MKIISWNVNGVRALERNGHWANFLSLPADIICIQETKASIEQLSDQVASPEGFFTHYYSSTVRKGYSGVAIYSKIEPKKVHYGIGVEKYDEQGRVLALEFDKYIVINVYVPNGNSRTASLDFKLEFYETLLSFMNSFREKGLSPIVCGDINVAHEEIDLARPDANKKSIGFLPEERAWIDSYLSDGYIDVFRYIYPDKKDAYTYWDQKSRARDRNVGWRIDYFFIEQKKAKDIVKMKIMSDVEGSDHCPIYLEIK